MKKIHIDRDVLASFVEQGHSAEVIADKLGYSIPTIYKRIREYGIPYGINAVQTSQFDSSQAKEPFMAWFAGWVASDGHIKRYGVTIEVNESDRALLETFTEYFQPSHGALRERPSRETITFTLANPDVVRALTEIYGIPRGAKSHTIRMPLLDSEEAYRLFIRGVFEGDGSLYRYSKGINLTIVSASESFIDSLIATVECYTGVTLNKNQQVLKSGNFLFYARKYRPSEVKRIASWIYSGHEAYVLPRKYLAYQLIGS